MNKFLLPCAIASAVSLSVLTAHSAQAAPGPALPILGSPTSISGGIFLPSSGDAKDRGGSTQIAFAFNYTVPVPNPLQVPTRTIVSLGIEGGSHNGNHSTIIPVTVSQVFSAVGSSPTGLLTPYVGIGVGAYVMNESGVSTTARLGGFGEVGFNFTPQLYVDAKYQIVQHGNGLVLNAGLRF